MKWIMGTIAALTVCAGPAWADGPQRAPVGSPFADGPELSALSASDTPVVKHGPSRGTTTIDVYAASAPNYGTAVWSGYLANALPALENGLAVNGDRSTDPTGYEHAPAQVPGGEIAVTSFNTWRGVVDPPAPFASEHGNRMHFGLHAYGDGITQFTLEDLTFEIHSSDPWDSLVFVGDFIGFNYNGSTRYGIDWVDGVKGNGDDVVYSSGNGTTPVDEIVYIGVGNAWWPAGGDADPSNPDAGKQGAMDDYFAWLASIGPIDVTCTYTIGSDTGSDTVTVVPPVELEIYPSLVPDETEPRVNVGDAPGTFEPDSWQNSATGKVNWHARYQADGDFLSALFPAHAATLTINDIESIRYSTKRPSGTTAGRDWWIQIYTRPIVGGDSSWYGYRFINNYGDHTETDVWTQYSTSTGMTFKKNSGTPSGHMDLATFKATYGAELVEMISIQTDSGWSGSFDGYMDGLIVTLTDGTVGRVNFVGAALTLEADDCQGDTGGQVTVELWMRDLPQFVTGFYAEVDYDTSKLTFDPVASTYTMSPFAMHLTSMGDAEDPNALGELQFDGSVSFGGAGTDADALLATLIFDVIDGDCTTTEVVFDTTPTFVSELSYQGVGVSTSLANSPSMTLDDTPPVLDIPDVIIECHESTDPNDIGFLLAMPFDVNPTLAATQAPGVWYTDRYAPAGFVSSLFDGDNRLKHSIDAADGANSRPPSYSSSFYNTQGRKYDIWGTTKMSIDLYIPSDWETTGRRMAGFWGTGFESGGTITTSYPIIEFTSSPDDSGVARFRGWDNAWIDMGLPTGFVYDAWYTLDIELVGTTWVYTVGDLSLTVTAVDTGGTSTQIGNVILQGHNDSVGVTYDIYWDNFTASQLAVGSDNCDPNPLVEYTDDASGLTGCNGTGDLLRTWTATDECGNVGTLVQTITIQDTTPPTITCPADITQTADASVCDAAVTVPAPTTGDNCGIDTVLNDYNGTSDASDTYPVGTTTVTWTVTDNCGNTATCAHTVTVTDDEDPTITCPADITQTADAGVCEAAVTVPAPATGDNCGVASVVNDYNATADATDTYPVGTTTVTWTVTDIYGNSAICSHTVTVTDDEDPTITCPVDINQTADPGVCEAAVTVPAPATGDNCGVASVINDYNATSDATDTYPVGTTTVTWTVTDIYGNSAICTHTVTVTDDEDPTISCPTNITQAADAGVCEAAVTVPAPATGDNCGVASVVNDYNATSDASDTYPVGTTTVTWTVTDIYGNSEICTHTVTVLAVSDLYVEIELVGVNVATTRCIHFQTDDCTEFDVELAFDPNGFFADTIEIPCGSWTSLCAKDEQHTLWDDSTMSIVGTGYVAGAVLYLEGGDTDNDADVDINDVTWFMFQYSFAAAVGGCPWDGTTRDADFSNDGTVGTEDYTFLTSNWLTFNSCPCTAPRPLGSGAIEQFGTVVEIDSRTLPVNVADYVDMNADGVIDFVDVQEFERANGLPNDLSELIRSTAEQQAGPMQKAGGRMQRP